MHGAQPTGSIMPVIITAHIAHSSARCGASHCGVIIHALAPVIGPYMSRAITTIHDQHTSGHRRRTIGERPGACGHAACGIVECTLDV